MGDGECVGGNVRFFFFFRVVSSSRIDRNPHVVVDYPILHGPCGSGAKANSGTKSSAEYFKVTAKNE